ncbi:hypothetical protein E3P99_01739 [Wallemia hederae]|uniref:Uncharacterized protein n=1 Tax=Wallemia hederae TaxID=1540922 RepID=A0A4T0FNS2_9BASI|nr:hypothetical protein E3P99_01739 [Wallemia hederae]
MIKRYLSTSIPVHALNLSYTLSLGHPLNSITHRDAIEQYKEGTLRKWVNEQFENKIRTSGAVVGENQRRKEINYWQSTIKLFVEDRLLQAYAQEHNIHFSNNNIVKREQRSKILDELAQWRVKPRTPEQQQSDVDDERNKKIIERTPGFSYVVTNTIMKQQIHKILLGTLHRAQLQSERVSRGWSLRSAHKRFPKDMLLDPHGYFRALGYTLHDYPESSLNIKVDRVSKFSERFMRRLLADLITRPPTLKWDKNWRHLKNTKSLPEMEAVLHDKPHKIAWRLNTPYTEPLRQALARRAKEHGFHFGDAKLHIRQPDPILKEYRRREYAMFQNNN